jgi:hypothetical protein
VQWIKGSPRSTARPAASSAKVTAARAILGEVDVALDDAISDLFRNGGSTMGESG